MNNVDGEDFTPAYTDMMEVDVVLSSNDNNNNFHADGSGNVCANELSENAKSAKNNESTVDEHDAASDAGEPMKALESQNDNRACSPNTMSNDDDNDHYGAKICLVNDIQTEVLA